VKEFLSQKSVAYTDHDVTTDTTALEEMRKITEGGLSVPVIHVGNEVIVGFDEERIKKALGIK
jgi:glutaredoxin